MLKEKISGVNSHDFEDVRFLLASFMRSNLSLALLDSCANLKKLRAKLKKPSATILHAVKELENIDLISKDFKSYCLSSKGFLYSLALDKLSKNLYVFESNREFWQSHSIKFIPPAFIKNAFLLKDSHYICSNEHDVSKPLVQYLDRLNSCEYMHIILPVLSKKHLGGIMDNLKRGARLDLIVTKDVLESLKKSGYLKDILELSKDGNIIVRRIDDDLEVFLTVCDKFTSLNLFFNDSLFDDSTMVLNETCDGIKWANLLFEFYLEKSVKVVL